MNTATMIKVGVGLLGVAAGIYYGLTSAQRKRDAAAASVAAEKKRKEAEASSPDAILKHGLGQLGEGVGDFFKSEDTQEGFGSFLKSLGSAFGTSSSASSKSAFG